MAKYTIPFTEAGFKSIHLEYETLQKKRPEIVNNLTVARDMGDRSENAAYKEARRKLSSTDSRLRFLKRIVEHARIVKPVNSEYVDIGTTVVVTNGTQEITFYIVGEYEADPMQKKLSHKSPVGHALLGKKVGDTVSLQLPVGLVNYTVISIDI